MSEARNLDDLASDENPFDPFESGTVWSQNVSSQVERKLWRDQWDRRLDGDSDDGGTKDTHSIAHEPAAGATRDSAIWVEDDNDLNETPESSTQDSCCFLWWNKGRTAPLLKEFENERRHWYLAQAGLQSAPSSSTLTENRIQGRGICTTIQSGPERAPKSPVSRRATELLMGSRLHSSTPGRAPPGIMQQETPGRKTWANTWGVVDSQKTPTPNSARKRRKNIRETFPRKR